MNQSEIIRAVMKEKGYTYAALAKKLGYDNPSMISGKLLRGNGMRTDWFLRMLNAMDCDIIIKDRIGSKKTWLFDEE